MRTYEIDYEIDGHERSLEFDGEVIWVTHDTGLYYRSASIELTPEQRIALAIALIQSTPTPLTEVTPYVLDRALNLIRSLKP